MTVGSHVVIDTSLKGWDSLERRSSLHSAPVRFELAPMVHRPIANEPPRRARTDFACEKLAIEAELGLLPLILRVEMRWLMVMVEHADNDPKKR
jgi:hypothetical protein